MPFGFWEILIIVFILLLLFGGKRIPQIAKSAAESIKNFKTGIKEGEDSENES